MKFTKSRIQTIIQEELVAVLNEHREEMELQKIYESFLAEHLQRDEHIENTEQQVVESQESEKDIDTLLEAIKTP